MARITGEIVIDRSITEVFDFVADERNEPMYNPEMLRTEKVTDGPIGVGTRFHAVHKAGRRPAEMTIEVTEYDRPYRIGSTTTMSRADIRGVVGFETIGASTRITWTWQVRPKGLASALTPIVGVVGRRSERACWEGLKQYLESSGALPIPGSTTRLPVVVRIAYIGSRRGRHAAVWRQERGNGRRAIRL
jgi:hypothetical protein